MLNIPSDDETVVLVGVADIDAVFCKDLNGNGEIEMKGEYYVYSNFSWIQGNKLPFALFSHYKSGDKVSVGLDLISKQVSFHHNGSYKRVAISKEENMQYQLVVIMYHKNNKVRIDKFTQKMA